MIILPNTSIRNANNDTLVVIAVELGPRSLPLLTVLCVNIFYISFKYQRTLNISVQCLLLIRNWLVSILNS